MILDIIRFAQVEARQKQSPFNQEIRKQTNYQLLSFWETDCQWAKFIPESYDWGFHMTMELSFEQSSRPSFLLVNRITKRISHTGLWQSPTYINIVGSISPYVNPIIINQRRCWTLLVVHHDQPLGTPTPAPSQRAVSAAAAGRELEQQRNGPLPMRVAREAMAHGPWSSVISPRIWNDRRECALVKGGVWHPTIYDSLWWACCY